MFEDILTACPWVVISVCFLCVAFTAPSVIGHAAAMVAGAGYALVDNSLTDLLSGRPVVAGAGFVMGAFRSPSS